MSARIERGALVRVVALTLSNGAPHPFAGRTGVVLEIRARVPYPVRVHIDGRPGQSGQTVMFAHDELERVVLAGVEPDAGVEAGAERDDMAVLA